MIKIPEITMAHRTRPLQSQLVTLLSSPVQIAKPRWEVAEPPFRDESDRPTEGYENTFESEELMTWLL